MYRWLVVWLPAIFWMAMIFYSSSQYSTELAPSYELDFIIHKTIHVIVFSILYLLLFRALYLTKNKSTSRNRTFQTAAVFALFYALSDELHQTFVPTRTGKLRDVGFDAIGIFFMYILIKQYFSILKRFL